MTSATARSRRRQSGLSLIEVLITLFVLLVGLLGVAGLTLQSQRASLEAYQRNQALFLLNDMIGRINANRSVAACYAITNKTTGLPYLGNGSSSPPACAAGSIQAYTQANRDLGEWDNLLKGTTEVSGGANIGTSLGARGCISLLSANVYLVTVAWQGVNATAAPGSGQPCGGSLYGSETLRRVVSAPIRIANLTNP